MKKILIINTGGTFNKVYNPINGLLEIDNEGVALRKISEDWLTKFEILDIISKDSLEMNDEDRAEILDAIGSFVDKRILIVHGTDTMDKTAAYLARAKLDREIVLTGAMVPFSINPIEATANLAAAYGYLQGLTQNGIYIVLNGVMGAYDKVVKNREEGYFEINNSDISEINLGL
jgi:L-asparaginase